MIKINSLKILKNAKTTSSFYFPCFERLTFQHIDVWFTLSQLTWSDLPRSPKYYRNNTLKTTDINNWPYFRNCFL